jgi:hypothetical protein
MNASRTIAKEAVDVLLKRKPHSSSVTSQNYNPKVPGPDHGREIFVFTHLQTNQTVYSLTKSLKVRVCRRMKWPQGPSAKT